MRKKKKKNGDKCFEGFSVRRGKFSKLQLMIVARISVAREEFEMERCTKWEDFASKRKLGLGSGF
ncbi:hypothetical protein F2Q70_00020951 [Brassica cretica]|uniref:Uncharacterized protein n=1 Tax=Brassica cretica TaxID=69181 RepID=A0A3N6SNP3_BRACR|nr:hypothetical protein F2Q70_00020951 [Brassica cretica]KAF3606948.1 hypothetical protein DY000_02046909 [Brassica cretica]